MIKCGKYFELLYTKNLQHMAQILPPFTEFWRGNNHLLEIRLLETGFLSRFHPNPKIRGLVLDN